MEIKILALIDHYAPGYKAGGPLRTMENMVQQLGDDLRFRVVTRDRDAGDTSAYPGLEAGRWGAAGKGEVIYLPPRMLGVLRMMRVIAQAEHDVLYLNSVFSPRFSFLPLLLRRLGAIPRRAVVLAPRGEFHPGALGIGSWGRWAPRLLADRVPPPKNLKKRIYLAVCRRLGLLRDIVWQASSPEEAAYVRAAQGSGARVVVAPDLLHVPCERSPHPAGKRPGVLKVAFVSRIHPTKNLDVAIGLLGRLAGEIEFNVYGPVADSGYWTRCRSLLAGLPPNVAARYHGPLPHPRVGPVLREHDLLLLPTRGENFGHVIAEAMLEGCLVLTSDRTPWRELERHGAGWDVPLERPELLLGALEQCVAMDAEEHLAWSRRAAAFALRRATEAGLLERNREMFRLAVGCPVRRAGPAPVVPARSLS